MIKSIRGKLFIICSLIIIILFVLGEVNANNVTEDSVSDLKIIENSNYHNSKINITNTQTDNSDSCNKKIDSKTNNNTYDENEDTKKVSNKTKNNSSKTDELTNDCCTSIIQISENESILSFRRDSVGNTINIYIENNSSYIKQYKTVNGYFFHVLINKEGWFVGTGGADSVDVNRKIESRALSMIKNNKITSSDLDYIANLHRRLSVGHFLIKAPNGSYGMEIYSGGYSLKKLGTLKNGQYIVCPNSRSLYHIGDYKTYTKTDDIVKASRLLALKDKYGINRRNIMTYHYKNNIVNSTIDFYVANDDGSYVGRRTGYLSDNIKTNTKTISSKSIPKGSKGLYVQTYTYKFNPKVQFTVTANKNLTKMGKNITLTAKLSVNEKAYDKGYVIFKINGVTIKDDKKQNIKSYIKNGIASLNYTIPDGWSAKSFKITAVYSKNLFGRLENKSYLSLERSNIHIQLTNVTADKKQVKIKGLLFDENNHKVKGKNIFSIKINGLTIKKENNQTKYFEVNDGIIDITIPLNGKYKQGQYTLMLSTGTRAAYNSYRQTTVITI